MVINAQNKEKYLEDLKNWLCELESAPLEEMGAFFRKRLPEYEARMTKFWGEDYKQFARAVPQSAKRILDLGCGTGIGARRATTICARIFPSPALTFRPICLTPS